MNKKQNTRKPISRGIPILWSFLYLILLITLYTPFGVLTISFIMIPPLILYGVCSRGNFILCYAVPHVLLFLLLQGMAVPVLLISLIFLIPVIVIGELYHRKQPAKSVVLAGTGSIIAVMLIGLGIAYASGFHVFEELQNYFWDSYNSLPSMLKMGMSEEVMTLTIQLMIKMVPLFMVLSGLFYTSVTHALGGRYLRSNGKDIPKMPPVREWMLPRAVVWYYLIALILDMFILKDPDWLLTTVLINAIPLLMVLFGIQAVSFLAYVSYVKKWNVLLPIAAIVIFPFLPTLVSLLGVVDVAFPIRQRLLNR